MKKNIVIGISTSVLTILVGSLFLYLASSTNSTYARTPVVNALKVRVSVIEANYRHIRHDQDEIKTNVKDIKRDLRDFLSVHSD